LEKFDPKVFCERNVLIVKYWWEFLRRNSEYQEDYMKYIEITKGESNDWEHREDKLDFIKAYGFPPLNFKVSFEKFLKYSKEFYSNPHEKYNTREHFESAGLSEIIHWGDIGVMEESFSKDVLTPDVVLGYRKVKYSKIPLEKLDEESEFLYGINTLRVSIDLNYPLELLIDRLRNTIGFYKEYFVEKSSAQYESYDEYLKIFDLRQDGDKYSVIVYKLFPGTNKKTYNANLQRVKRGYKRACEIIDGEWERIR